MRPCPSREQIRCLLFSRLGAEEARAVSDHLDECGRCRAILAVLSDDTDLRSWFGACAPLRPGLTDDPRLADLIARLSELPDPERAPSRQVAGLLPFLAPPRCEGELGRLGPYGVVAVLGHGGTSIVLKARDEQRRNVALKILRPELADASNRARFVRGARTAAQLDHDQIVKVFAVEDPIEAPPYLVMECVEGPTLRDRLRDGPRLTPTEAARLGLQVAEGLGAAHAAGLVHRDIKSSNILLDGGGGRARIADFGLARTTQLPAEITREGEAAGTPEFMSPEQVLRPDRVDGRADTYGLGVILYESLTGEVPFRGTLLGVLKQLLEDDPVPPRRRDDAIPRALETICLKCLEKEPRHRYDDAEALAADLRRFLAGAPIEARPLGFAGRQWRRWRRQPRVLGLVLTLAAVVLAGFAGVSGQWWRAETLRVAALHERDAARREHGRAEANFRLAEEAVDRMLTRVSEVDLADIPQMETVRRDLLEEALRFYQVFLRERGPDPAVRREAGQAQLRVGMIREMLGQSGAATNAYLEAIAIFKGLAKEAPAGRKDLARSYTCLGNLLVVTGRPAEADAAYQQALASFEGLPEPLRSEPEGRHALANFRHNEAFRLVADGRPGDAEPSCRAAIALKEQLVAEFPANWQYGKSLATSYNVLGSILKKTGRIPEARSAYLKALTLQEHLAARYPGQVAIRAEWGTTCRNLGLLLRQAGQAHDAQESYRSARGIFERLAAEFPGVPRYPSELGETLIGLSLCMPAPDRLADARSLVEQAVREQGTARSLDPRNPSYRGKLRGHLFILASMLLEEGEHGAASRAAVEAGALADHPLDFATAARVLAACVSLAEEDRDLGPDKRRESARSYSRSAARLLGVALKRGHLDDAFIKHDPGLVSLQARDDFRNLLRDVCFPADPFQP